MLRPNKCGIPRGVILMSMSNKEVCIEVLFLCRGLINEVCLDVFFVCLI